MCLLIFRENKPTDRDDKVLFIDASKRFQAGTNQNTMSDDDVAVIDAAYKRGIDLDGENGLQLRLVDVDEIAGNGFDLNIGRYITVAQDAEVDVEAALIEYREARERLRELEDVLDAKLKAAGFDA